ncbi:MAG: hypothetical protein U0797_30875, partial [Gemmataceae bacterium]
MLPQTTNTTPRGVRLLLGALLAGTVLLAAGGGGRADDARRPSSSLSLVPADAAVYSALLRGKEQFDLFYNSNAYKALRALPLVKMAWQKAEQDLAKDDGPIGMYRKFVQDKDNKELVDLLVEGLADEVFLYGGRNWGDAMRLALAVNNAQSWAPLTAAIGGQDQQRTQMRSMLLAAQKNHQLLKVPELILGLKIKSADKAEAQINRLEKLAAMAAENFPPLKGKTRRQKLGDSNFLTVEVDGSVIPWDDVNLKDYEDKKDEFEDLVKAAKKLTACVSVGVKDGYLLFGVTSSFKDVERIGSKGGPSLASREELKPLEKVASKPLTGISYTSKEYLSAVGAAYADFGSIAEAVKNALAKNEAVKEERKKAIEKDIDALVAESRKADPRYGAQLAYSYLTPTGYEGYTYNYGNQDALKGVSLRLGDHFGGRPIFAAAFGCKATGEGYRSLVKWAKVAYGHGEAVFLDSTAPDEAKEIYKKVSAAVLPVWKRIDEITTKQLLPAVQDTGMGIVLDSKWASKQWHNQVPPLEKEMPMLELGLLVGLSDAKGFEKALTDYRKAFNDLYAKGRDAAPNKETIPPFALPDPTTEKVASGTLVFYPLPEEAGLDKQVQPVAGIGKDVSVLALSKKHAERLMTRTPLTLKGGPLARKGDLVGLSVFDWPALIDTVAPWAEFGLMVSPAELPVKKEDALKQLKTVFEVLKCFKGGSSASYVEDGKL